MPTKVQKIPKEKQIQQKQTLTTTNDISQVNQFELLQRKAKFYACSSLVPQAFRHNLANCLVALEMAQRFNMHPYMVMQNMYIVHGKPSWTATFIISCINGCGRFTPLMFKYRGKDATRSCVAYCTDKATHQKVCSIEVSIAMAYAEGWYDKNGSKWKTMPDLMLQYRAATFFGRAYAPDFLMGLYTKDEMLDMNEHQKNQVISKPIANIVEVNELKPSYKKTVFDDNIIDITEVETITDSLELLLQEARSC